MKIVKILVGLILVVGFVLALVAPVGPLPGFFIGGDKTPAPAKWMDTSSVDEIKLKVPGALPRVVIIWVIEYNEELHVVGASDSGWVSMLGEGGAVEMRLGEATYALTAERVTDDLSGVLTAYVDKYRAGYPDIVAGFPSLEEGTEGFSVFRLNRP